MKTKIQQPQHLSFLSYCKQDGQMIAISLMAVLVSVFLLRKEVILATPVILLALTPVMWLLKFLEYRERFAGSARLFTFLPGRHDAKPHSFDIHTGIREMHVKVTFHEGCDKPSLVDEEDWNKLIGWTIGLWPRLVDWRPGMVGSKAWYNQILIRNFGSIILKPQHYNSIRIGWCAAGPDLVEVCLYVYHRGLRYTKSIGVHTVGYSLNFDLEHYAAVASLEYCGVRRTSFPLLTSRVSGYILTPYFGGDGTPLTKSSLTLSYNTKS